MNSRAYSIKMLLDAATFAKLEISKSYPTITIRNGERVIVIGDDAAPIITGNGVPLLPSGAKEYLKL